MPRLMSVAMTSDAVIERRKTDGLTLDRLREVLTYNPQTGRFCWTGAPTRTGRDRSRQAGREAGVVAPNGYAQGMQPNDIVTRIEFRYLDRGGEQL